MAGAAFSRLELYARLQSLLGERFAADTSAELDLVELSSELIGGPWRSRGEATLSQRGKRAFRELLADLHADVRYDVDAERGMVRRHVPTSEAERDAYTHLADCSGPLRLSPVDAGQEDGSTGTGDRESTWDGEDMQSVSDNGLFDYAALPEAQRESDASRGSSEAPGAAVGCCGSSSDAAAAGGRQPPLQQSHASASGGRRIDYSKWDHIDDSDSD